MSFVPCIKNPYDQGFSKQTVSEEDRKLNREYIEGLYVWRIVVVPSRPEMVYFLDLGRQGIRSSLLEKGQKRELKGRELVEVMERRF